MASFQFTNLSLSFGEKVILQNANIKLSSGTKAALVGANGSGKSTLIKIMAGEIEMDSGEKACEKGIIVSYVKQGAATNSSLPLMEECDRANERFFILQKEIEELGEKLTREVDNESALHEQAEKIRTLEESGFYTRKGRMESILTGLGFTKEDFTKKAEDFSLGFQMRISLAKALIQKPDVLLLDEPTNYLDIESRDYLEKFLLSFKGALLLVSHDRFFLDAVVNEVYELFMARLTRYSGNYTQYEKIRREEIAALVKKYEAQQKEIEKLEAFIRRFSAKPTKAAQAMEKKKKLEKMEKVEIPEHLKVIHFSFPPAPHLPRIVLKAQNINKTYDGKKYVLKDLSFTLEKGDKLVVVGRNGEGKSTLLRLLTGGDKDFTGEIKMGDGVKTGYFSQDSAEKIMADECVLDYMERRAPFEMTAKVRDLLGAFLFRGDDVLKSLKILSGGEKSRLALLSLLLENHNLLILDEPTNHLDIASKDVLVSALKSFSGAVIFVSHDRAFMSALSNKVLELKGGSSRFFVSGYEYYLEKTLSEENLLSDNPEKFPKKMLKNDYTENKKIESAKRKLRKETEKIEAEIKEAEEQKASLLFLLSKKEVYSSAVKSKKTADDIAECEKKIEKLNEEWENAMQKLLEAEGEI